MKILIFKCGKSDNLKYQFRYWEYQWDAIVEKAEILQNLMTEYSQQYVKINSV